MDKIKAYVQLARVPQYVKNTFIWLPLFFGYKLSDTRALWDTFWAFLAFCLAASCVYVLNDICDIVEDREHPANRSRPLASGVLRRSSAYIFMSKLFVMTLIISITFLSKEFVIILGTYISLNVAYSFFLKNFPIVDVVCIALGFVLRIISGGISANVHVSHWLVILTFLLALFLALAKRRDDLVLAANGNNTRRSSDSYNIEFVSMSLVFLASVIMVSYILYTVSPEIVTLHGTDKIYLTGFWVILGLFRYMQITIVKQRSGSPTDVLLKDRFLQAIIIFWILHFFVILYT